MTLHELDLNSPHLEWTRTLKYVHVGDGDVNVSRLFNVISQSGLLTPVWVPWVYVRDSAVLRSVRILDEKGLYAAQKFPAGVEIGRYMGFVMGVSGRVRPEAEVAELERTGRAGYLMTIDRIIVDGNRPTQTEAEQAVSADRVLYPDAAWAYPGSFIHIINDFKGTGFHANVSVEQDGTVRTITSVPRYNTDLSIIQNARSELLYSYGKDYWDMMQDSHDKQAAAARTRRLHQERAKRSNARADRMSI
jgi:hypothetical protein